MCVLYRNTVWIGESTRYFAICFFYIFIFSVYFLNGTITAAANAINSSKLSDKKYAHSDNLLITLYPTVSSDVFLLIL